MNAVLLEVIRDKMGDGKLLEIENQAYLQIVSLC